MNCVNSMVQIQIQSVDYTKGQKKKKKKIVNGLFGINDLNEDVNNHLCSLNIRKKHDKSDDWSERLIIKN